MTTVNEVADFIIVKTHEAGETLNVLKLQKLVYYVQAWHLANYNVALFPGGFEAWVHGPVNRELYVRFRDSKRLYSPVTLADLQPGFDVSKVPGDVAVHVQSVLEAYSAFSDSQLEDMTHHEQPWIDARRGYAPNERCENELSEKTMSEYYRSRFSA